MTQFINKGVMNLPAMAFSRLASYMMLATLLVLAFGAATISLVGTAFASNGNPSQSAEPEVSAGKNPQPNPPPPSQGKKHH
jgi:hypothetical protein